MAVRNSEVRTTRASYTFVVLVQGVASDHRATYSVVRSSVHRISFAFEFSVPAYGNFLRFAQNRPYQRIVC